MRSIWLTRARLLGLAEPRPRVVAELALGVERVPILAVAAGQLRRALDAAPEALRGRPQRELRVDPQLARDVDRREQHVAGLVEARRLVARRLELVELAAHRVVGHLREVEARRGGPALDLARVQRARQVLRHLA